MVRLILVEDESVIAADIQSRLRGAGYDIVGVVATGEDAIAQAGELRPDAVLMDIVLKGEMDGIDAAKQITGRFDIPIIFLTVHTDAATLKRAAATASYGFLVKPFDELELGAAIEMAIHRHVTEAKARESDRRIGELTESLSEVIFETDMAGNITFINQAGLKEFGYTKEQVEGGMTLYDFLSPSKHEEIRESIGRAVIDEPSEWTELPGLRRDGSTLPVSVRASLIVREGVPVGIRGIALNVTEQRRAEQKLRESERRIRELTDALPVVVYEADETGRITFANATAFGLFGYTKEDLEAGMSIFQMLVPADAERAHAVFRRRMSGEDVGRVEYTGLRKDGSTFPISIRSALMRQDAAVVGQRGVILDITELKQTERALAWESAINSTIARLFTPLIALTSTLEDIALAILDEAKVLTGSEHGFVGYLDPVTRDLIAFATTQMMPEESTTPEQKRQIRFPVGPDGSYAGLWGHALTTKTGLYTNAPATHPAGLNTPNEHTPVAQFLAAPALIGEEVVGQIALANPGRDYTKRDLEAVERLADVYAVAVVRTREEKAIRAALEERETLLKEVHHRVKNNMQIISSLLSLQAAQATEPETIEMLNDSQQRIRSMALIHDRLYRSASLAEIDFGQYVESLVDELLRMYNVPLGVITIATDIENVQLGVDTAIPCALIINELVSNSLKHAFPDGRTGAVTIALRRANGVHMLTVADNGVGFPRDVDFRATDSLGMQLVVTLVNQLEGTIELNRENGTAFAISFHVD